MRKATYVGPVKRWKGKTALARRADAKDRPHPEGSCIYQFDDFTHPLSHGWHRLPRHHVRITNR